MVPKLKTPTARFEILMKYMWFSARILVLGVLLAGAFSYAASSAGSEETCSRRGRINQERWIKAEDAKLYLLIRGADCNAPVLLWLHGGPGGAERPLFRLYDGSLEKHFVVAYLDQRGAGRSWDRKADSARLTVERHRRDLDFVVDELRAAFPGQPLILVGHSWGAALAILFAGSHPDKVDGIIAANPLVDMPASQRAQIAFAKASAIARDDVSALDKIRKFGSPPFSGSEMVAMQKIVGRFGGEFHRRPDRLKASLLIILRGYESLPGVVRLIKANDASLAAMASELGQFRIVPREVSTEVPLLFMLGRHDHLLDPALALALARSLRGDQIDVQWFDGSAHNIPFEEPDAFVKATTKFVAQLPTRSRRGAAKHGSTIAAPDLPAGSPAGQMPGTRPDIAGDPHR